MIRVGAPSETELKSRKEAFEDAVNAVTSEEVNRSGDERTGLLILKRALEAPTGHIVEHSGPTAASWSIGCGEGRATLASMPFAANTWTSSPRDH